MDPHSKASPPPPSSTHLVVINPTFCVPYPLNLAFTTKTPQHKSGELAAMDSAGNIVFQSKASSLGFTQLVDVAGHTLLTMKSKFRSFHERWQAFAGDSTKTNDLIFSIRRSSALQIHDEWLVFLAGNTREEVCDFKIIGNYRKKNCTIYRGDSSSVIAQLRKDHGLNLILHKHAFGVTISPSCDYSFVAALIAIFHVIYGVDAVFNAALSGGLAGAAAGAAAF
ncbi:hypothetical protein HPP92_024854 [Vanilla planifolia]|uniref:Uncharacterized protein n=1 Tax=Vanilla planifolia TaxID=51239 RepID=A0A835U8N2_VANPL|nr:hypothetical protein HPP92_025117 [Vanilla planifolia]KAG0453550.1 hypothetical protein HPP92_024854 [Vanilla planifolia]